MSYVAVGVFLVWGAQRPRLDEAFEILSQRDRAEFSGFTEENVGLLSSVLNDYSGFSRALVGRSAAKFLEPKVNGWLVTPHAHLAVKPEKGKATKLTLESQGSDKDYPATIRILGKGFEKTLTLNSPQPFAFELSATEVAKPSILKIEVAPNSRGARSSSFGLRVVSSASSSREAP
jgi:hypothetical protein